MYGMYVGTVLEVSVRNHLSSGVYSVRRTPYSLRIVVTSLTQFVAIVTAGEWVVTELSKQDPMTLLLPAFVIPLFRKA